MSAIQPSSSSTPSWISWMQFASGVLGIFVQMLTSSNSPITAHINNITAGHAAITGTEQTIKV